MGGHYLIPEAVMASKQFQGIFLRIDRDGFIQPDSIIAHTDEQQKVIEKAAQIILKLSWLIRILCKII